MAPNVRDTLNIKNELIAGSESVEAPTMDFKQKIFQRNWVNREQHILDRLPQFKSPLHLGCSDAPFTDIMLANKCLLHSRLLQRSPKIVGFDLNAYGLQLLRRAHPDAKFVQGDAEQLQEYFGPNTFDLVIAGEIVEHLSNPGAFLTSCAKVLTDDGVLLITIPNTFGIRRYIHSLFGVENYHPDHTFYFSENTLKTLAQRHGFSIFRSYYYASSPGKSWLKRLLYTCIEILPAVFMGNHFLDGMVIEFKKRI